MSSNVPGSGVYVSGDERNSERRNNRGLCFRNRLFFYRDGKAEGRAFTFFGFKGHFP